MPDPIAQESGFDQSLWDQTGVQHQQMWKAQAPIVQQQIDSSDPRTGLDYLKDIPTGMIGGVEGFTRSALGVADHVAEFFGGDLGDFETTPWNRVVTTKTWAGGLTEGITEFAIGQALVGGVVNGATSGMKLGKFALAAKKVGTAALTDFIAFDGRGERFSNIIEDHVLSNPITRYLSAKPDDNWAEARLKNALEGLGVGWVTDKFLHKLGIVKKAQGGVTPELLTEADELVKNSEHLRTLNSQIDAVAPNNFTPDQKRVGWAMWLNKAKELGEEPEAFIKSRLSKIEGEEAFRQFQGAGSGEIPLKQGMTPKEMGEIVDENLEAGQKAQASLPKGDDFVKENADIAAESAEASKIPLEEPKASVNEIPLKENALVSPDALPLAEIPAKAPLPSSADDLFAKGAVGFVNDSQAVMYLFKNADFSTFAHESFHIWRRLGLSEVSEAILAKAVGISPGKWDRAAEEKAARLFENYLAEGKSPNPELEGVFSKTKAWMKSIYGEIENSDIGAKPSKDVQAVFDSILTGKPMKEVAPELKVSGEVKVPAQEPASTAPLKEQVDNALAESDARIAYEKEMAEADEHFIKVTKEIFPGEDVLMQTARERRMTVDNELHAQAEEAVVQAIKNGTSPVDEAKELLFGHYNRIKNSAESAQEVVDTISRVFDKAFHRANGGSVNHELTLKWTKELFESMELGAIPDALAKDAEKTRKLFVRVGAYRMATINEATVVKRLGDEVNQFRAAGQPVDEILNAFSKSLRRYEELRQGTDQLSTGIARALDAHNIKLTPSQARMAEIDKLVKTIRDAMTDGKNPVPADKFLAALNAAQDDGAITGIFKGLAAHIYSSDGTKSTARKLFDAYMEVWMNGLLSGMRTFDGNFVNNTIQMFLSPAEQWVGSAFVKGGAGARKEAGLVFTNLMHQTLDFFGLSKTVSEMNESIGHSARGMTWKALKDDSPILEATLRATDTPNHAISAENFNVQNATLAKAVNGLGNVVNIPARLLMTADEAFKQMQYRARVNAAAILEADRQGLSKDPQAFKQFINEYNQGAFDASGRALNEKALKFAQQSTMTEPLSDGFGKMLQDAAAKSPIVKLFLPFVRTPANIATRAVQYTPGLGMLQKQMVQMLSHPDPAIRSVAMGRQAIGTMFWTAAIGLVVSGRITGHGPSNEQERNALLATGWQPYSVVTADEGGKKTYFSLKRLDPTGMIFGLAADYAENAPHLKDGDAQGLAQALLLPIANNLTSRTYMQGLSEFVNIMSQPDRKMEKWLQARAGSHVWTIAADFNNDPYLREARSIMDAVKRRVPGQSESLAPRRNIFGEPISAPMADNQFAKMMSPVSYSHGVEDNVKEELATLKHGFSLPSKRVQGLDLTLFKNDQGRDAYDRLQEQVGAVKVSGKTIHEALTRLIESPKYQSLPKPESEDDTTNPRIMAVNRVLAEYRQRATEKTLKEFPEIGQTIRNTQRKLVRTPAIEQISQALNVQ